MSWDPTHAELVERCWRWILRSAPSKYKCSFAVHELTTVGISEIPDVLGWKTWDLTSVLIECKRTRADFLRDKKKWFRSSAQGSRYRLGLYRFYACPPGLITPEDIEKLGSDWGLLWIHPKKVELLVHPTVSRNQLLVTRNESYFLRSALRRVHLRGDLEKIYDRDTILEENVSSKRRSRRRRKRRSRRRA